ncbi:hypothetical protein VTL71DRAFT_2171 [Oculimacula yallundae]|uniref:Zn(2)-C6 fungal-type domain-containing protein n=1 Tax=Oculimacula yallundae TaxID=86028 RepID=A0ABR4C8N9_9HELO
MSFIARSNRKSNKAGQGQDGKMAAPPRKPASNASVPALAAFKKRCQNCADYRHRPCLGSKPCESCRNPGEGGPIICRDQRGNPFPGQEGLIAAQAEASVPATGGGHGGGLPQELAQPVVNQAMPPLAMQAPVPAPGSHPAIPADQPAQPIPAQHILGQEEEEEIEEGGGDEEMERDVEMEEHEHVGVKVFQSQEELDKYWDAVEDAEDAAQQRYYRLMGRGTAIYSAPDSSVGRRVIKFS